MRDSIGWMILCAIANFRDTLFDGLFRERGVVLHNNRARLVIRLNGLDARNFSELGLEPVITRSADHVENVDRVGRDG